MFSVDVDEADVEVLQRNVNKSKELFAKVNALLRVISSKTLTASRSIKPVFAEINILTEKKASLEQGLALLQSVSSYAKSAAEAQEILKSPIETVGINSFLSCLELSKELVKEMKLNIKDFDGVVVNFANSVDLAEVRVLSHFSSLIAKVDLAEGTLPNAGDVSKILRYYSKQGGLREAYDAMELSFSKKMLLALKPYESQCTLDGKQPNTPFEKGSTALSKLTVEFSTSIKAVKAACDSVSMGPSTVLRNTIASYMETRLASILAGYCTFLDNHAILGYDLFVLEILENLQTWANSLKACGFTFDSFPDSYSNYVQLAGKSQKLLTGWVNYVEARVSQVGRFNDLSVPEVVVEVLSKIRRICEFSSFPVLFDNLKLGAWLSVSPPLRFISTYTSVVAGAEQQAENHRAFLVSSFLLDLIDELMIEVETGMKDQPGDTIRKLTQGFTLVKNLVMIETIVKRSDSLYQTIGQIGMERLQRLKNRFLKMFLDDWNHASYIIIRDMTNITTTNAMNGGQSSTKEKDQIKELFKNFNEAFDEALKNYERFNIQEKDLRTYLASEIKKLILNAYNKLYSKYGAGEFTKNRAKYIKFDKMQLERLLTEKL